MTGATDMDRLRDRLDRSVAVWGHDPAKAVHVTQGELRTILAALSAEREARVVLEGALEPFAKAGHRLDAGIRKSETPMGLIMPDPQRIPHPANGMSARVYVGDGAVMTIVDPTHSDGMEWTLRYGRPEVLRFSVASVIESYEYLLSDSITTTEAVRRIRIMRGARAALLAYHTTKRVAADIVSGKLHEPTESTHD